MPRAFKHALGLIRPATAFQTAAVTPVSTTVTPVQHSIPVAAAVRPISIATTGQLSIATAAVFNPALVAVMTAAGEAAPAARGKPRGAMTVPVYPFIQAGDTSLYENAANPAEKWYLPRYRLATQRVSGGNHYRARLAESNGQWRLEFTIEPFAPPEIGAEVVNAQPLPHQIEARLRWEIQGTGGAMRDLPFTERLDNPDGTMTFALVVQSLQERDELYGALTTQAARAELVLGRVVRVALALSGEADPAGARGLGELNATLSPHILSGVSLVTRPHVAAALRPQVDDVLVRPRPGKIRPIHGGISIFENGGIIWNPDWQVTHPTPLPAPDIEITGVETFESDGAPWARYNISVKNWQAYGDDLFAAAPDLPPCGNNANSARTWVDIYDDANNRLYGFCALGKAGDLQSLWVARPVASAPAGIYIQLVDRRVNLTARSNTVTPPAVTLYEEVTRVVEQREPLFFHPDLHGYIFQGFNRPTGTTAGLTRRQVNYEGRWHAYYQDPVRPHLFYYLPDTFKLLRKAEPPHSPVLVLELTAREPEAYRLTYAAVPHYDWDRLEAAEATLKREIPAGHTTPLALEPFQTSQVSFAPFDGSLYSGGGATFVNLTLMQGVAMMSRDQFAQVWDELNGAQTLAVGGKVRVSVQGWPEEEIPLTLRLDDMMGTHFTVSAQLDEPNARYLLILKNTTESPLQVGQETLSPFLQSARFGVADVRAGAWGQVQILEEPLPPNHEVRAALTSPEGLDLKEFLPLVDTDRVRAVPDRDKLFEAMLSGSVREYQRAVTVQVPRALFAAPPNPTEEQQRKQIVAIQVDFTGGGSALLIPDEGNTPILSGSAAVRYPLRDVLLGKPVGEWYEYRVTVVRNEGASPQGTLQRGSSESFFLQGSQLG